MRKSPMSSAIITRHLLSSPPAEAKIKNVLARRVKNVPRKKRQPPAHADLLRQAFF